MNDLSFPPRPDSSGISFGWSGGLGRLLVVDDNPQSRAATLASLADDQCQVSGCAFREAPALLQRHAISLVVLDICPARMDGFAVLRRIRAQSEVPVILTTRQEPSEMDRILGLELGADDVLPAPVSPRELLARSHAILRRQEVGRRQASAVPARGGYRFGGWELRRATRLLRDAAGEVVDLTKTEYALLVALLEAPRRPLSRAHLIRATKTHEDVYDRSIDVQVLRLRRKLAPGMIRTERGLGYMLDAEVELLI